MEELKHSFIHYFDFYGTAKRKEFIFFWLFFFLAQIAWGIVAGLCLIDFEFYVITAHLLLYFILTPLVSVTARRFHDIGFSGWWCFILLLPIINILFILLLCALNSKTENNAYLNIKKDTPVKIEKQEEQEDILTDLPRFFGDMIIKDTPPKNDPKAEKVFIHVKKRLPRLRNEGVTDRDIRWWWNMTSQERRQIILDHKTFRNTFFLEQFDQIKEQAPDEEAASRLAQALTNKNCPTYDDDPNYFFKPDDPLPYELKDRVDAYIDKITRFSGPEKLQELLEPYAYFNAFIREEIKNNKL